MTSPSEPRRRLLVALGGLSAATALVACAKKDDPAAVVPGGKKHDKVATALDSAVAAVGALTDAIDRFDNDNWRDVVPDVKQAAANVSSALDDLKTALAGDAQ